MSLIVTDDLIFVQSLPYNGISYRFVESLSSYLSLRPIIIVSWIDQIPNNTMISFSWLVLRNNNISKESILIFSHILILKYSSIVYDKFYGTCFASTLDCPLHSRLLNC